MPDLAWLAGEGLADPSIAGPAKGKGPAGIRGALFASAGRNVVTFPGRRPRLWSAQSGVAFAARYGAHCIQMRLFGHFGDSGAKRRIAVLLTAGALLATTTPMAHADDTMRCGTRLVSSGDGKDKVRTLCGEPTSISFVGIQSAPRYYYGPYDYSYFGPGVVEVPVEVWTYNFGSSKLLRKLRYVGDELDQIRTDGYGD